MRYFKYKGSQTTEKIDFQEQYKELYKELTREEKRIARKEKVLDILGSVVFFTVFLGGFACCVLGLKQIQISFPKPLFEVIMRHIANFILGAAAFVLCLIIGVLVSMPIFGKNTVGNMVYQKFLSKEYTQLCEFYGLQEPCIVTKCYTSSDKKFKNHDVCIFVADEELRITTNLKNGFIHSEKDLGCHAFRRDEISLTKIEGKKFLMAELKAGETAFLLGYRAKGFIDRNFLFRESDTQTQ